MPSKAQGLSLNTIIIAAIVLIVLLILVGMTTGYFSKWKVNFFSASNTCQGSGGQVIEKDQACSSGLSESSQSYPDVLGSQKCCAKKTCEDLNGHCCGGGFPLIKDGAWSCAGKGGFCCPN